MKVKILYFLMKVKLELVFEELFGFKGFICGKDMDEWMKKMYVSWANLLEQICTGMVAKKKRFRWSFKFDSIDSAVKWVQSSCIQLRHLWTLSNLLPIVEFQIPYVNMAVIIATHFPSNFSVPSFALSLPVLMLKTVAGLDSLFPLISDTQSLNAINSSLAVSLIYISHSSSNSGLHHRVFWGYFALWASASNLFTSNLVYKLNPD